MKSVLITGGTGSFGSAFVRRCLSSDVHERICILSRDELKQANLRAELESEFPYAAKRLRFFIGDVRDLARLKRALTGIDVVIHAAALKRIEQGEYDPVEFVKTNVIGSMNVIDAAIDCRVKKVVALSSDKACNPINLYGKSKSIMESVFTQANVYSRSTRFACVRYGNVFNSRGSVIQLWETQRKNGERIKLTDPGMTRFYLTLDEACRLVEDTIQDMQGGEVFVPKTRSMSLGNLASAWLNLSYCQMLDAIDHIGIRPGEKLHEELVSIHESYRVKDQGNRYVVLPSMIEWQSKDFIGEAVGNEFCYSSLNNPRMIHFPEDIAAWLNAL